MRTYTVKYCNFDGFRRTNHVCVYLLFEPKDNPRRCLGGWLLYVSGQEIGNAYYLSLFLKSTSCSTVGSNQFISVRAVWTLAIDSSIER